MANLVGLSLMAEGYQINAQSARQLGMGHVGSALKLGAESMLFNPAGMAFMNGNVDLSFGATAISSKVTYTSGTYKAETDNPIGTPLFGYAGFKVFKNLYAGVSITNPAGNSLVWPDNWNGATFVQNISLKVFSVQPTLSYKFSEKLSLGAGLMVDFGSFEMNKGLMPVGALAAFLPLVPAQYQSIITNNMDVTPLGINLSGNSKITYGFNVGILYNPTEKLSIGLSYRSKVMMKMEGGATNITYGAPEMEPLFALFATNPNVPASIKGALALDGKTFNAELPIPSNTNLGVAYQATSKFLISAELQYVGWKTYDTLSIVFPITTMRSPKNFSNTMIYRIGGEYKCSEKFTTRFGVVYDTTPVDVNLYGPETPGANKFSVSAGFTWKPINVMAVDFGLQYINGAKTNGKFIQNGTTLFGGDFKSIAYLPSLGVRFNF